MAYHLDREKFVAPNKRALHTKAVELHKVLAADPIKALQYLKGTFSKSGASSSSDDAAVDWLPESVETVTFSNSADVWYVIDGVVFGNAICSISELQAAKDAKEAKDAAAAKAKSDKKEAKDKSKALAIGGSSDANDKGEVLPDKTPSSELAPVDTQELAASPPAPLSAAPPAELASKAPAVKEASAKRSRSTDGGRTKKRARRT